MYAYVCIYIYISVCLCMYVCVYVYIYIYIYIYRTQFMMYTAHEIQLIRHKTDFTILHCILFCILDDKVLHHLILFGALLRVFDRMYRV